MAQANNQSSVLRTASCLTTFADRQTEKFPLNTFFCLQTFSLYNGVADYIGSVLEYPLALLQLPLGSVMPSSRSEIQTAINQARFRTVNTDVI